MTVLYGNIRGINKLKSPKWAAQLTWPIHQGLPQPCTEIDFNEWMRLGFCGHECGDYIFHDQLYMPESSGRMLDMLWSCEIRIYYTYGLVIAHGYSYKGKHDRAGDKAIFVPTDGYNLSGHTVRFFKIGCEHHFIVIPEESYMCYHASICTKCGMRNDVDSSD